MSMSLRERLAAGKVLICDGAMGTMLQALGLEVAGAPEQLNLREPDRVASVHRAYVEAGADIIITNTFGGNRIKLGRAGLADIAPAANKAAVEIARRAVGGRAFVAGDIGPTGELLEPFGTLSEEEAVDAFAAQAAALAEAGVDLFMIETMSDLSEAKAAVAGVRRVSDLPLFCTMTFDTGGRTMMGVSPSQAAETLSGLQVDGFGANCGQGPDEMEKVVAEMLRTRPAAVVVAQPNAGVPSLEGDKVVYSADAETMARYAKRYAELGVRVVGSCCGSTPEHTAAIARALASFR
ncbi:MAG: homocysteine S-methyltransferase family protein [Chloroflexota bacterium]